MESDPSDPLAKFRDERKFLHNLASPLGAAIFALESANDSLHGVAAVDVGTRLALEQAAEALERMRKMLEERREILIQRGF